MAKAEPIAIIGLGCRFPDADNPQMLWQLLLEGHDAITEVPSSRFDIDSFYDPRESLPGKLNTRYGGFLEHVEEFDPIFFSISPKEAIRMDPKQRLLLEVTYEALEDAGIPLEQVAGSNTGVFIGALGHDFEQLQLYRCARSSIDLYSVTGGTHSVLSGRLSYAFDLRGPSMTFDTACSSSMVALHIACQSLRNSECKLALVGGVNLVLTPESSMTYSKANMLSPDGKCKFGDATANGFVRSDGVGVIALKSITEAEADGDRIYAVIAGSAVNNDGQCSGGLTKPGQEAHEAVIETACRCAGVDPGSIFYVEAHGTGTEVGDPTELGALGATISKNRPQGDSCIVGSIKSNIGHTEGAAGAASIIKLALLLTNRTIPPSLHFKTPNPTIPWNELSIEIPSRVISLPKSSNPTIVGASSFGISGTNAHVVMREYRPPKKRPKVTLAKRDWLLPLSAHNEETLRAVVNKTYDYLNNTSDSVADICFTATKRRALHDYGIVVTGQTKVELAAKLKSYLEGDLVEGVVTGQQRYHDSKLVFVFPGQGSQWVGMGRQLYKNESVFRNTIDSCELLIREELGWSLVEELHAKTKNSKLEKVDVVQPALFALQVALANLWRSWGVEPNAVIGHSMGEIAAATVSGILLLKDAVSIVCRRSRLIKRVIGKGGMAVVDLSIEEAQQTIIGFENVVSIAVSNSSASTVLSGDHSALHSIIEKLNKQDIFARFVNVNYPSHCQQMDCLRDDLLSELNNLRPRSPELPMLSTVTGKFISDDSLDAEYWADNIQKPVLFAGAIRDLMEDGHNVFLEISAHPVLHSSIQQEAELNDFDTTTVISMRREREELPTMLTSLWVLSMQGFPIHWKKIFHQEYEVVSLPTYAWQREKYWRDDLKSAIMGMVGDTSTSSDEHPLLGRSITLSSLPDTFVWENRLSVETCTYLKDHRVQGEIVLPAAAYVEMAVAASKKVFDAGNHRITEFRFEKAMFFQKDQNQKIQVTARFINSNEAHVQFKSQAEDSIVQKEDWISHGECFICRVSQQEEQKNSIKPIQLPTRREDFGGQVLNQEEHYSAMTKRGLIYGPLFQGVQEIWVADNEAIGHLYLPEFLKAEEKKYYIHPALLDSCFQIFATALPSEIVSDTETFLPVAIRGFRVLKSAKGKIKGHLVIPNLTDSSKLNEIEIDIVLRDSSGAAIAEIDGLTIQRLEKKLEEEKTVNLTDWLYGIQWEPVTVNRVKEQPNDAMADGFWLVFMPSDGFIEISEQLESPNAAPNTYCLVSPGGTYRKIGENHYEVNPENASDFESLAAAVFSAPSAKCCGVIHLWSMNSKCQCSELRYKEIQNRMVSNCASITNWIQAQAEHAQTPRLWIITRGAQKVLPDDNLSPTQAPVWGLGRVIAREHPETRCSLIDLHPNNKDDTDINDLLEFIELDLDETQIGRREDLWYGARLCEYENKVTDSNIVVPLKDQKFEVGPTQKNKVRILENGTYLITGGLSGLGLETAKWMVESGARNMILIGRSGASDEAGLVLNELRKTGAEILVAKADVSEEKQMNDLIKAVRESYPPLKGIIHAAGVLDDGIILKQTPERFKTVFDPKVGGALNLHRLTKDENLDFFVMYSSAASVIGSPGQGNYSAANEFLDCLAHYRVAKGEPALSVNWGPWSTIGLAAKPNRGKRLSFRGIESLTPEQGITAIEELIQRNITNVSVISFNLSNWFEHYPDTKNEAYFQKLWIKAEMERRNTDRGTASTEILKSLYELNEENRKQKLKSYLNKQISKVLGISEEKIAKLDMRTPLNRLGIDSLMAVELKNVIESELRVSIPVISFLKGGGLSSMIDQILISISNINELGTQQSAVDPDPEYLLKNLESLSDADIEQLLQCKSHLMNVHS